MILAMFRPAEDRRVREGSVFVHTDHLDLAVGRADQRRVRVVCDGEGVTIGSVLSGGDQPRGSVV